MPGAEIRPMDKPEKLILGDGEFFRLGYAGVLAGVVWFVFDVGIALTQTKIRAADLLLPMAAISAFWFAWLAIHVAVELSHRYSTKRDILRLFEKEIWQFWQFQADKWRDVVEAEYRDRLPKDDSSYIGALYSAIAGVVMGAILVTVGLLTIKDEQIRLIFYICAVAVVLLFAAVGLFQPIRERHRARAFRRNALRVSRRRVWFGAEGVYHEAFGYDSLKNLQRVIDVKYYFSPATIKIPDSGRGFLLSP